LEDINSRHIAAKKLLVTRLRKRSTFEEGSLAALL
jgi:hypothetical protein